MNPRLKLFGIILVLVTVTVIFNNSSILQAQELSLPDGWCQQPSNVLLRTNAYWGASDGGIRALYQAYNQRIVLQRTVPREVVQVVEEGVTLSSFNVLLYSANCRYLIATIRDMTEQYSVVVYDLQSAATTQMGAILNSGHGWHGAEFSPEGTYLLVTATDGLYLWNLTDNTQTQLSALIRSDCQISTMAGCDGHLSSYREARWDVPHGLPSLIWSITTR